MQTIKLIYLKKSLKNLNKIKIIMTYKIIKTWIHQILVKTKAKAYLAKAAYKINLYLVNNQLSIN